MQGGIHPEYTGATYLGICRAIKEAVPDIHIHAFSPLEIWQGAKTLGRSVPNFLRQLKEAGLSSLPGTAAEVLGPLPDRKSTRLNSSHMSISYAVFCLKKKNAQTIIQIRRL